MANYLTNNNPQRPQWLRLLALIILFIFLLLTLTSCHTTRTTQTTSTNHTTSTDTIYKLINTANHTQATRTDTLHDSIVIREVVTQQGTPIYKERLVYRNHTSTIATAANTHQDTTQTATHNRQTTNNTATKTTTSHPLFPPILICIFLLIPLIYTLKIYGKKH